jgi:hypothetical protein
MRLLRMMAAITTVAGGVGVRDTAKGPGTGTGKAMEAERGRGNS